MTELAVLNSKVQLIVNKLNEVASEGGLDELAGLLDDVIVLLENIDAKTNHVYLITSTTEKPVASTGDELITIDNGNYYVYYDDAWHLKEKGVYLPITMDVTFTSALGGVIDPASKEVTYDDAYGTLADVTLLGYILSGWYLDEDLTDEIDSETIVRKEDDHSLYAKLTPVDYTITYHLDGGINNESNPTTYTIEDDVTFLEPTKEGHTFDGWFSDETKTTETTGWSAGATGDYEVWAKFTVNP